MTEAGSEWTRLAPLWERHWGGLVDPARELIAERTGIGAGTRVLDMGCGTGEFCALAATLGASASGLDASEGMLRFARERAPRCDFRQGAIEALPWDDDSFDVVTGFLSFQFAAERIAPFREAGRVAFPGGLVAVCVWRPGERPGSQPLWPLLMALEELGGEPEDRSGPPLGDDGVLEAVAAEAGLDPVEGGEVGIPYEVPDLAALEAALEFGIGLNRLRGRVDDELISRTIAETAAPGRRDDGSYRFENPLRWMIARA